MAPVEPAAGKLVWGAETEKSQVALTGADWVRVMV